MYSLNSQFRFKISILRPSLCDYSDAYIFAKGTITVANTAATEADADNTNRKAILKNWAPFTNYITKTNNTQMDDAQYIDVVMSMYNLIEYNDNYSKASGILW